MANSERSNLLKDQANQGSWAEACISDAAQSTPQVDVPLKPG